VSQTFKKIISNKKVMLPALFSAFFIWLVVVNVTHEPWRDEAQAWLLVRDTSFIQLLAQIRYEGHPLTWYLLIMPLAKLGLPFVSMRILHFLIAAAVAAVVIFALKTNLPVKLCLLVATPFAYEYAAHARNYSIGILLILLLAVMYEKRYTKFKIPFAVCLFFALQCNIYTSAILCVFCAGEVFLLLCKKTPFNKETRAGIILSASLGLLSIALLYLLIGTDALSAYVKYGAGESVVAQMDAASWQTIVGSLNYSFAYNIMGNGAYSVGVTIAFYVIILLALVRQTEDKRTQIHTVFLLVFSAAAVFMCGFLAKGYVNTRNLSAVPYFLFLVWYIHRNGESITFWGWDFKPALAVILFVCLLGGGWNNLQLARRDIIRPYTFATDAANYLKSAGYDSDDVLIIEGVAEISAVSKALCTNITVWRNLYSYEPLDLTYAPYQITGVVGRLGLGIKDGVTPDELLAFAEEQAKQHLNEYRAILFFCPDEVAPDLQLVEHPLVYAPPYEEFMMGDWENVTIWLLAENGELC